MPVILIVVVYAVWHILVEVAEIAAVTVLGAAGLAVLGGAD